MSLTIKEAFQLSHNYISYLQSSTPLLHAKLQLTITFIFILYYLRHFVALVALNILTFPKYCFFGLDADLGTAKAPLATVFSTEAVLFSGVPEAAVSHLPLPNDSSSVTTFAPGTLESLALSLVDTGLAPSASSHTKYLHSDRLPLGHA